MSRIALKQFSNLFPRSSGQTKFSVSEQIISTDAKWFFSIDFALFTNRNFFLNFTIPVVDIVIILTSKSKKLSRPLKNKQKLTQLIDRIQKSHNVTTNLIFALQETHVERNDLKYKWKGNYIFTEGCGTHGGLITLLSDNIMILEQYDIDHEVQITLIEIIESKHKEKLILINLHSPCPHDETKTKFYEVITSKIKEIKNRHIDSSTIILGDFNTTFEMYERNGTIRSPSEVNVAKKIQYLLSDFNLIDCWENDKTKMTWRHGQKMSRLDRIKWSQEINVKKDFKIDTDWTYTQSDHCAVIVKLKNNYYVKRDKIVRLDTFFMGNVALKQSFLTELRLRMDQISETQMNPHQILEYLKMSIRSIGIEISSNHKKEIAELFLLLDI